MTTAKAIDADVTAALDRWAAAINTPDHQAASEALDALLIELCATRKRAPHADPARCEHPYLNRVYVGEGDAINVFDCQHCGTNFNLTGRFVSPAPSPADAPSPEQERPSDEEVEAALRAQAIPFGQQDWEAVKRDEDWAMAMQGMRLALECFVSRRRSSGTSESPDSPDDEGSPANLVRSAFIAGMDRCREVREAYGEWPTLPGRVDLAEDYLSTVALLGPEPSGTSESEAVTDATLPVCTFCHGPLSVVEGILYCDQCNPGDPEPATDDERAGMEWWNGLTESVRGQWLEHARNSIGGASAADAWECYKRTKPAGRSHGGER